MGEECRSRLGRRCCHVRRSRPGCGNWVGPPRNAPRRWPECDGREEVGGDSVHTSPPSGHEAELRPAPPSSPAPATPSSTPASATPGPAESGPGPYGPAWRRIRSRPGSTTSPPASPPRSAGGASMPSAPTSSAISSTPTTSESGPPAPPAIFYAYTRSRLSRPASQCLYNRFSHDSWTKSRGHVTAEVLPTLGGICYAERLRRRFDERRHGERIAELPGSASDFYRAGVCAAISSG